MGKYLTWDTSTLPKFNMEPENDGFQVRNLLFLLLPFSDSMLNFGRLPQITNLPNCLLTRPPLFSTCRARRKLSTNWAAFPAWLCAIPRRDEDHWNIAAAPGKGVLCSSLGGCESVGISQKSGMKSSKKNWNSPSWWENSYQIRQNPNPGNWMLTGKS